MKNNEVQLKEKKLFVLDMDGTFYLGEKIIEGSLQFIEKVKETGRDFIFFTNNSSRTPEHYIAKLASMGCSIGNEKIATSGDVAVNYLKKTYPGKRVYFMGTELVAKQFAECGIQLVQENPEVVVVGFDMELNYEKLTKACTYIRQGCTFLATHLDLNCPTEDGFIPDCGAMCALITASTGVSPQYLGKPCRETVDFILDRTGLGLEDIVFVGDRLYTDIATGYDHGAASLLVLSGETKEGDLAGSRVKPDFVYQCLGEVAKIF